jgi:predicted transcriptional regulator of viral defense system
MKSANGPPHARDYIENLAAAGQYHFDSDEARDALGVSPAAVSSALHRLAKNGLIASPARGFYLIVPPEYRSLRCLPAEQFIPALMAREGRAYYAGLLTAAQYHGAAHQRPQAFQVFVDRRRRDLSCGRVRVSFMLSSRLEDIPVQTFNTPRGTLRISTPEATAIDLVGYYEQAGGLDQVVTVLSELAEHLRADELPTAADAAPVPWAQRLGYLLEQVGASEKAVGLKEYVRARAEESTALLPGAPHEDSERDASWKLYVNAAVEPTL